MKRRRNAGIPSKYLLVILTIFCIMLRFTSYVTGFSGGPLQLISSYIFVPMQRGLDYVGSSISISNEDAQTREELLAENEKLRQQVEDLSVQLNNTRLQQEELETLQELYQLDQSYMNYETTGARVIGRGASNWFDTFTIDKGSDDGIREDMNVIAGGGLVGIVTDVQATYSVVRTVINDTTNISGMTNTSWDHCIVSGSLSSMTESNTVRFSDLEDTQNAVSVGDAIVTSNISDKYLPGILIGYITTMTTDSNDLTKSGTLTPVVDFKHLQDVLIITQVKDVGDNGN